MSKQRTNQTAPASTRQRGLPALLLFLAVLGLAGGCTDDGLLLAPTDGAGLGFAIRDAAHGGPAGFYFLPPLVSSPGEFYYSFDPDRTPVVTVCALAGNPAACSGTAAQFELGAGPDGIKVDPEGEAYAVMWKTPDDLALGAGTYRIEVRETGVLLGWADLWVVAQARDARQVSGGYIALVRGQPLNIKFRLEDVEQPLPPPAPAITGIEPAFAFAGEEAVPVEVTITGTHLLGAALAVGGAGVAVSDVVVVDESTITATFTLAPGAEFGNREVTVTTAGGASRSEYFLVAVILDAPRGQTQFTGNFTIDPLDPLRYRYVQVEGVQGQPVEFYLNHDPDSPFPPDAPNTHLSPFARMSNGQDFNMSDDDYRVVLVHCSEDHPQLFRPGAGQHTRIDPVTHELAPHENNYQSAPTQCHPLADGVIWHLGKASQVDDRGWWLRYEPPPEAVGPSHATIGLVLDDGKAQGRGGVKSYPLVLFIINLRPADGS